MKACIGRLVQYHPILQTCIISVYPADPLAVGSLLPSPLIQVNFSDDILDGSPWPVLDGCIRFHDGIPLWVLILNVKNLLDINKSLG
jgi:hypothetical protein